MDIFELYQAAWVPLTAVAVVCFLYIVGYTTLTLCGFRYLRLSIGVTTQRMLGSLLILLVCLLALVVLHPPQATRVAHEFDRTALRVLAQRDDTTYFVDLIAGSDTTAYEEGSCGRDGKLRYRSTYRTYKRADADSVLARLARDRRLAYDACFDVYIHVQPAR